MNDEPRGNRSGNAFDVTQQPGEERQATIRYGQNDNDNMDDPSADGGLDADSPSAVNTAAGFSVGGTGVGIEPGVDADLGAVMEDQDDFVADVYGDGNADVDEMTDRLGMGTDEV